MDISNIQKTACYICNFGKDSIMESGLKSCNHSYYIAKFRYSLKGDKKIDIDCEHYNDNICGLNNEFCPYTQYLYKPTLIEKIRDSLPYTIINLSIFCLALYGGYKILF